VDDEAVRDALGLAGVFLCMLGLLYGGFWRIQMAADADASPPSDSSGRAVDDAGTPQVCRCLRFASSNSNSCCWCKISG
jgi:hypothetical protein